MLFNYQINIISNDLAEKYFEPFSKIRKEVTYFLMNYATEIETNAKIIGIPLFDAEQIAVYYFFKKKYEIQ